MKLILLTENEFSDSKDAIAGLIRNLEASMRTSLPDSIKGRLTGLLNDLRAYDYEALKLATGHTVQPATGELFNDQVLIRMVKTLTKCITNFDSYVGRWSVRRMSIRKWANEAGVDVSELLPDEDRTGIRIDPGQCRVLQFTRDTDARNNLYQLDFVLCPGYIWFANWQTDASSGDGGVIPNSQFERWFDNWTQAG